MLSQPPPSMMLMMGEAVIMYTPLHIVIVSRLFLPHSLFLWLRMDEQSNDSVDTTTTEVSLDEFLFSRARLETILPMSLFMDHEPSRTPRAALPYHLAMNNISKDGSRVTARDMNHD
jgi:hypothetical protein